MVVSVSTIQLSKAISHALRHEPWLYELELDVEGWVNVAELVAALRQNGAGWEQVQREDIEKMIAESEKRRHEIVGDRIRAMYGHTVPGKLQRREQSLHPRCFTAPRPPSPTPSCRSA